MTGTASDRNPEGWHTIPVEVVTDGKSIGLIGEPPDVDDPLDSDHNCDAMGCRWSHVLAWITLDTHARAAIAHLLTGVDPAPPSPSLREQVLARIDDDDLEASYCPDCGEVDREYLAYIDQYANGERWKCRQCGREFMVAPRPKND